MDNWPAPVLVVSIISLVAGIYLRKGRDMRAVTIHEIVLLFRSLIRFSLTIPKSFRHPVLMQSLAIVWPMLFEVTIYIFFTFIAFRWITVSFKVLVIRVVRMTWFSIIVSTFSSSTSSARGCSTSTYRGLIVFLFLIPLYSCYYSSILASNLDYTYLLE